MKVIERHDIESLAPPEKAVFGSIDVYRMGNLPSRMCIMISSPKAKLIEEEQKAIYLTALEASLSGYDVATFALKGGMHSVLQGVEDGGGRLHLVSVEGLETLEKRRHDKLRRVLLTGGSVLACHMSESSFDGALEIALSISNAMITTGGGRLFRLFLDNGLDVAILRSSLVDSSARKAAMDGCPVISSFSSFLELPKVIAYKSCHGRYGFGGDRFDILTM